MSEKIDTKQVVNALAAHYALLDGVSEGFRRVETEFHANHVNVPFERAQDGIVLGWSRSAPERKYRLHVLAPGMTEATPVLEAKVEVRTAAFRLLPAFLEAFTKEIVSRTKKIMMHLNDPECDA